MYESAVLLDDKVMACQMHEFINKLVTTSTDNISDLKIDNFREVNPLLEGHEYVKNCRHVMLQRYCYSERILHLIFQ